MQNIWYHVAIFLDSFLFDMQHDHVLKKWNFDRLTPWVRGGSASKIFATMLLYFMIPFNLVCNMTMF